MEIYITRDGQQTGPFSQDSVQTLVKDGSISLGDLAWHKGLPGWLPLNEVLNPGSSKPSVPPPSPGTSGIRSVPSGISKRPATAKQKALLRYIGARLEDDVTKDEAAVAISDALENPKLTPRFTKWGEEKLRLHPDIYQDELDYRRANRVGRYIERCQSEAAEVVKDVTKAHAQVLVELLDKKHPSWESDSRAALWDYLLPTVAEHFPQLVREEWKGRLKVGGAPKVAASYTAGKISPVSAPAPAPSAAGAALRGIIYGGIVLGVAYGAMQIINKQKQPETTQPTQQNPASVPVIVGDTPKVPELFPDKPAPAKPEPAAPGLADAAPPVVPPVAPAPVTPPAPEPAPVAPTPAPAMAEAPAPVAPAPVTPAAPPVTEPAPMTPPVAPAVPDMTAPAPAVAKDGITITKSVAVQLQFGRVTLNAGTRVRFIALEGQNVRVNFNNNVILIPVIATDVDPNAPPTAAEAPAPMITPPVTAPPIAPTMPATPAPAPVPTMPRKPSDDL